MHGNGRGSGYSSCIVDAHPCDGCCHAERCRAGLACRTLQRFMVTGCISEAPRQPSKAIYAHIFRKARPSEAERRRRRQALAAKMSRELHHY